MPANNPNQLPRQTVPPPRLRFKQFEGSDEWKLVALREVLTESRIPAEDELGKRLTVSLHLRGVSVREDRENAETGKTRYFRRRAGQFIYGKQNIFRGSIGIVPDELDGYLSSQDLPAFDVADSYNVNFLYDYFARPEFYIELESLAVGTGSKRVHPETIYTLKVPFPSLAEQTHIAAALSSLDNLITAHTDKLEALRQHKRGLMQGLFPREGETVPRLRFPEFVDAGAWEVKKLGEVLTISNGRDYKHLGDGDIPVYGSGGYMCSVNQYLHDGESVSIGRKGTIDKPDFIKGRFWAVDTLFYTHSYKETTPKFILYVFQGINWREYNSASGIPSLTKSTIEAIETAFPSLPEQTRIAECLSSLDDLITAQADKVAALQTFKRGLMQGLFPAV